MKGSEFLNLTLYRCVAERDKLDKSAQLLDPIAATGSIIKGDYRADAPEIVLSYQGELAGYNYIRAEIAAGVYYYYYATFTADIGQTVRASCRRDAMMSFKDQLLQCKCICASRVSKNAVDRYIQNGAYKTRVYNIIGSMDDPTIGAPDRALPFDNSYVIVGMYG